MKRITLFSTLTDSNQEMILGQILPTELIDKAIAYVPSDGVEGATFSVINNRVQSLEEQNKLLASNIVVISGGNTFNLLHNLRESGLGTSIRQFLNKPHFVLSGFSAGALVLTPSIKICNLPGFDENLIGLKDLEALNIVGFEVFPHYNKDLHEKMLEDYRRTTNNRVNEITDNDYISVDL